MSLNLFFLASPVFLNPSEHHQVCQCFFHINNPPIIIADEPLGNLDSANAKIVLEFLKELNEKDGRTIIMVTHNKENANYSDIIIQLKD